MILNDEHDVKVAIRPSLRSMRPTSSDSQGRAVLYSRRNFDRSLEVRLAQAAATAFLATTLDNPPFSGASWARGLRSNGADEALLNATYRSGTTASRASLRAGAGFGAGASTLLAPHFSFVVDNGVFAVQYLFERDFKLNLLVLALPASVAWATSLTGCPKEEIEQVLDAASLEKRVSSASRAIVGCPESVVALAFFRVG
jgi:hypothetical protein